MPTLFMPYRAELMSLQQNCAQSVRFPRLLVPVANENSRSPDVETFFPSVEHSMPKWKMPHWTKILEITASLPQGFKGWNLHGFIQDSSVVWSQTGCTEVPLPALEPKVSKGASPL